MPPSDLTTKDIFDRLDSMEARSSVERTAIRSENRYLMLIMILMIGALAGVQVYFKGMSMTSPTTQTVTVEAPTPAAAAPVAPVAPPVAVEPAAEPLPEVVLP